MKNILLALISLLLSTEGFGYVVETISGCTTSGNTQYCCSNRTLKFKSPSIRLNRLRVSFPDGAAQTTALIRAWSRWNNSPSVIDFSTVPSDATSFSHGNGVNEVVFINDSGAYAMNQTSIIGCSYTETDVVFGNQSNWVYDESANIIPFQGSNRSFIGTAIHELGHALGLMHEDRYYNIMGEDWTHVNRNGNSTYYGPGEDGSNGAANLYGSDSDVLDLGISAFKHIGSFTQGNQIPYSDHGHVEVVGATSCTPSTDGNTGEMYCARADQNTRIVPEFTVENNGSRTQDVEIKLYLSTNNIISTADTYLQTYTSTLGRDTPSTFQLPVNLPRGLQSNTRYWIGAIINNDLPAGTLPPGTLTEELTLRNNAAAIELLIGQGNRNPTARSFSISQKPGSKNTISNLGFDPDGDSYSYSIVSQPSQGSVSVSGLKIIYTGVSSASGSTSFQYRITDEFGASSTNTVSVTFIPYSSCGSVAHGTYASRTQYQSSSVPFGETCVSETQRAYCYDGNLGSYSPNNYNFTSCSVAPAPTPSQPVIKRIKRGKKNIKMIVSKKVAQDNIVKFQVFCKGRGKKRYATTTNISSAGQGTLVVKGLKRKTSYRCKARAFNGSKWSAWKTYPKLIKTR